MSKSKMLKRLRKFIAHIIYRWADKKYGVTARGPVERTLVKYDPTLGTYGIPDFNEKQSLMLKKWHYWMRVKNKIYGKI